MISRLLTPPKQSFFLFGARGTGKSTWIKSHFKDALIFDLLDDAIYRDFLADPSRLEKRIPPNYKGWIVIDEVQRIPALLNSVHRLIENRKLKFVLTGSSARKIKRGGANLLAGRALLTSMYPLTIKELGSQFNFKKSLRYGHLPAAYFSPTPEKFLASYITTYMREEVEQEQLVRKIDAFAKFLEAASFSQAQLLNISAVAQEAGISRKAVEDYFQILEDLLISFKLPVFTKRAKRKLQAHAKFFFFDCGVFRTLRPKGYLDSEEEMDGAALETLVTQEVRALNDLLNWQYQLYYWRTAGPKPIEVDLILYGPRGLIAIEIKRSSRIKPEDLKGLKLFKYDYPKARVFLFYTGTRRYYENDIEIIPIEKALSSLDHLI